MEYCQYHPVSPATYLCHECASHYCDICVDESAVPTSHCFHCKKPTESLGARFNATPFWRRLQESFHYPINTNGLIVIFIVSLLMAITPSLPFPMIIYLIVSGAFIKYCFSCLEETAQGSNQAPDITVAYEGGFLLAIQVFAIMFGMTLGVIKIYAWLGIGAGILTAIIAIVTLPAILINLALSREFFRAINPANTFGLISAIGLPYGLLLALIFIMLGSVTVIQELISPGGDPSFISLILQSIVSNYYSIVIFHIMGYMLFQYQARLGFSAREGNDSIIDRSDVERGLVHTDVLIKSGDFDKAASTFAQLVKHNNNHSVVYRRCFDFLTALKNTYYLTEFAPVFFRFLQKTHLQEELLPSYKKILTIIPNYQPTQAADRLAIARACHFRGNNKLAVKLLNGLHKQHPNFKELDTAYYLMADVLSDIKNMQPKADQYRAMAKHFSDQNKKRKPPAPAMDSNERPLKQASINEDVKKVADNEAADSNSTQSDNDPGVIEFVSPFKPK